MTPKKYFSNSNIEEIPCDAKVLAIRQKIPNGAIIINTDNIFKTKSFIALKKSNKILFLSVERQPPRRSAKNIT